MKQEENVDDSANEPATRKPNSLNMKKLQKIQNNRHLNQKIYQLYAMGRYQECLQVIEKAQPDQYKLYMKSLIYKQQFKLEKSLALLTQCEGMNKLNFVYLKNIAKNFYLLGKYKSSLEVAKEAYRLNSSDYEIFYIFAKIQSAMKDTSGAITNLQRSILKQPNQQSYLFLANLYMQKGSYRQASAELKKALTISPQNDEIHQMLGEIEAKLGHKQDSLNQYNLAIEINPSKYEGLFSIAALKHAKGQVDEALKMYTRAYQISQNSSVLWNSLASVLLQKGKEIAAYCCLKKALFLDPFRFDIHYNLGLILMKVKKYVGAQLHFRTALKIKNSVLVYNVLGVCLAELGDFLNAEKCFEQIMSQQKEIPILDLHRYKINYLCLLAKKGDKQKCNKLLKQLERENLELGLGQKLKQIKESL